MGIMEGNKVSDLIITHVFKAQMRRGLEIFPLGIDLKTELRIQRITQIGLIMNGFAMGIRIPQTIGIFLSISGQQIKPRFL